MVASYDFRPGNGAGLYSGRQEIEEEIKVKVRPIKKEEGKIQIGKVSKNKNTNTGKPHSQSAEINK